jgi:predicted transcriptional regulator
MDIRSQIIEMIRSNPRTLKELSQSFGLSKERIMDQLKGSGAVAKTTMMHNGRVRPVAIVHYCIR